MSFPGLFIVLGNLNIARTMAEAPQNTVMRGVLAALSYLQKTDEIMKAGRRREEAGMKVKAGSPGISFSLENSGILTPGLIAGMRSQWGMLRVCVKGNCGGIRKDRKSEIPVNNHVNKPVNNSVDKTPAVSSSPPVF